VLRARLTILGSMLAVLGLMLFPATASAQYAPTGDDFITCTPDPAEPGDEVSCTSGYWEPGSEVTVLVTASTLLDTTVTADEDGIASFEFDIPEDHATGEYTVTLTGTGMDGEPKVLSDTGEIAEAEDEDLADTGAAGTLPLGTIALVALVLGAAILVATRRRTNATVDA
jgi:LPXTG-motif cell wall-anchored protein